MEQHSTESHRQKLNKLCRLCGNRVLTKAEKARNRKKLLCGDFTSDILMIFNVYVQRHNGFQPKYFFCYKCLKKMGNLKKRGSEETLENALMIAAKAEKMWVECDVNVSESECVVCVQFYNTCLGNRQFKQTNNRLATTANEELTDNITLDLDMEKPSTETTPTDDNSAHNTTLDIDDALTNTTLSDDDLTDSTTLDIDSSATSITHSDKIDQTSEVSEFTSPTPAHTATKERNISTYNQNCSTVSQSTTQTTPPRQKLILVECATSPMFKEDFKPKQLPDIHTPLTDMEEQQHTNFIKRKLAQSNSSIITCKTRGQPISVMKITNPRKSSADSSASTKRKLSQHIETTREAIAGTSKEATQKQHTHELNRLSNPVCREVFKKTGLESRVHIDKHHALAMKEAVGLTYSQQRELRHFMRESGVRIAHEGAERKVANELIGNESLSSYSLLARGWLENQW